MLSPFEPHKYSPYHTGFYWRGTIDGNVVSVIDRVLLARAEREMNAHPPCRHCSGSQMNLKLHPDG